MRSSMNRRTFISGAASAAVGVSILPRHVLGGPGFLAPSDTVNVAAVGAGGMGANNMNALRSQNIVALADVDFDYVARSFVGRDGSVRENRRDLKEAYDHAQRFTDWRIMFEEVPEIDAVMIATPDHNHAVIANAAMKMGKHVYVQKPLTWSVSEARTLQSTAEEMGVVTQMGNQGHSGDEGRRVIELVRGGAIGRVYDAHIWTDRPLGYWRQAVPRPTEAEEKPADLNWDVWIGPAPYAEYHSAYHPFLWRGWVDYGVGALGDMGAHLIDHAYWALELAYPDKIWGTSTPFGGENGEQASWPAGNVVYYEYVGVNGEPIQLTWYDGGLLPKRPAMLPDDVELNRGGGAILVGDHGILLYDTYGNNPRIYPEEVARAAESIPQTVPRVQAESHEMNWINAIVGSEEISCPFSYAAPLTENMLLGTTAVRAGQVLLYDPVDMRFPNAPEAEQYLGREYRTGWEL